MTGVSRPRCTPGTTGPIEHAGDGGRPPAPARFPLLAETALVGVVVIVLALGVVTLLPALAAGAGHLRRHAAWRSDPLRLLLADFRRYLKGCWTAGLLLVLVLALLLLNLDIAATTSIPGSGALRWVTGLLGVLIVVVAVRAASARALHPDVDGWPSAWRRARALTVADPVGSALLATAVGLCAVVVWMLPVLVVLTPGMLALAMVGTDNRLLERCAR